MARPCARPTCSKPAAATLSYDYAGSQVWIDHLTIDDHPMQHDLCLTHADKTTPPVGWLLTDRRHITYLQTA